MQRVKVHVPFTKQQWKTILNTYEESASCMIFLSSDQVDELHTLSQTGRLVSQAMLASPTDCYKSKHPKKHKHITWQWCYFTESQWSAIQKHIHKGWGHSIELETDQIELMMEK